MAVRMPTYRWRIEFSLPGVPIAQAIALDAMQLTPCPRDKYARARSAGALLLETEEYLHPSDVRARAMSRLQALAMAAAAIGGSVQEPEITSINLQNEKELEAAGLLTPLLDEGLLHTFNVIAPDIDGATLAAAYRVAVMLGDQEAARWLRSVRWLWKANADADAYDQFLALWISFNVLYGPYKARNEHGVTRGEQGAIQAYLEETISNEKDAEEFLAPVIR